MKLLLKILIPVLVLVGSVFAAKIIRENRPEPRTRPQFPKVAAVDATTLAASDYSVIIRSQGTVEPTQSATLVAEVTGTVVELSENFVVGGSFSKGDVLLQIDQRDYAIALTQAEANLAQATAALDEETARGQLARDDWESLGRRGEPSAISLRLPQMSSAKANQASARAQVEYAQLELGRTQFLAPFDGQILEADVNQGQFVTRGNRLGQIYSNSSVDVRLPLSSRQLTFLDIPKPGNVSGDELPSIELTTVEGDTQSWVGEVVRAEGVDASTQQLNVIARVKQPADAGTQALRIGQYVKATINGQVLKDVFVLPRTALREDREVLIVNGDSQLERREVNVAWFDEDTVAINEGLEPGVVLVTTPLSTVTNGTPVRATIDGVAPPPQARGGQRGNGSRGEGQGGDGARGNVERGNGSRGEGQGGDGERGNGERGNGARGEGRGGDGARGNGQRGDGNQAERAQGNAQRTEGARGNADQVPTDGVIDRSKPSVSN